MSKNEKDMTEQKYTDQQDLAEEVAWQALMEQPQVVATEWLGCTTEEIINLYDYLNEKLHRRISSEYGDFWREKFMKKLKAEALL